MDLNNRHHVHAVARDRLANAQEAPKIALIFGGIIVLSTFLASTASFLLGLQLDQAGGLRNLGTKSLITTIQTILPLAVNLLVMAVELGFLNTMLRVSRRQFISPKSLHMGFARFWPLLKIVLLQSGLYFLASMASMTISMQIFLMTPMSNRMFAILNPLLNSGTQVDPMVILGDPEVYASLLRSMSPMMILMVVLLLAIVVPIWYHYRMANYVIIDKPGIPALMAMRESRLMMRRNCLTLFRLDLSMWWYYAAMILVTVLGYGDMLLPALGVNLSLSPNVGFFLFLILYLLADLAMIFFLRPHVETVHALAYDSLKPQEKKPEGAVLGSIFSL